MEAEVMVEGEMAVRMETVAVEIQSLECHCSLGSSVSYFGGLSLQFCSALSSTTGCKPVTGASRHQMQQPVMLRSKQRQPLGQHCFWEMTGHRSIPVSSRMPAHLMASQQDTQQPGLREQALSAGLQERYT